MPGQVEFGQLSDVSESDSENEDDHGFDILTIDEIQALPKTHANFTQIGPLWDIPKDRAAVDDPTHAHWTGRTVAEDAAERKTSSMSMLLAGSDKFDSIVRDPLMREIHRELAGGACMLSGAKVVHSARAAQLAYTLAVLCVDPSVRPACRKLLHREVWTLPRWHHASWGISTDAHIPDRKSVV